MQRTIVENILWCSFLIDVVIGGRSVLSLAIFHFPTMITFQPSMEFFSARIQQFDI